MSDFHGAERTFQLLTQAAGRAGRGSKLGEVVIQTYNPDHYAIITAQKQDYERFYEQEIEYRKMMFYPPVWNLLVIWGTSLQEEKLQIAVEKMAKHLSIFIKEDIIVAKERVQLVGPTDATISKINDVYRKVIYMKTKEYQTLVRLKDRAEWYIKDNKDFQNVSIQFDFNPISSF